MHGRWLSAIEACENLQLAGSMGAGSIANGAFFIELKLFSSNLSLQKTFRKSFGIFFSYCPYCYRHIGERACLADSQGSALFNRLDRPVVAIAIYRVFDICGVWYK